MRPGARQGVLVCLLRRQKYPMAGLTLKPCNSTESVTTMRLKVPIETLENASYQLLRMAPDVVVVSPVALRRAIVQRLKAIQAFYTG